MLAPLLVPLLIQSGSVKLSLADLLSIYTAALHSEASRVTGEVNQFTVTASANGTVEQPTVPFSKLRPRLANFPAPVVEERAADSPNQVSLYVTITDVVDSSHVVVSSSHYRYNSEGGAPSNTWVMVRGARGWKLTKPTLPAADERELQRAAFIYLLSHTEHGYKGKPAYVGVITEGWKSSVDLGWHPARDPDLGTMQVLWRHGWSLKYISETPEGRGYSKPRSEFGVGDIRAIDRSRALVHLVSNHWYMEPGYNQDFGPEGASEANVLARRERKGWRISGIRGDWYSVPAE